MGMPEWMWNNNRREHYSTAIPRLQQTINEYIAKGYNGDYIMAYQTILGEKVAEKQADEARKRAEEQAKIAEQNRIESQTSLEQSNVKKEKASAVNANYHANNSQEKSNLTSGLTGFAKLRRKILGSDDKLNIGKLGE